MYSTQGRRHIEDNNTSSLEDEYVEYQVFFSERVVYEFFDSNSGQDNHGFNKNEWPFNWNTSVIVGLGSVIWYFIIT